jgi:hypothetical protein
MVEDQARTSAGFDALPGPFPLEPPFPSSWEAPPPPNPPQAPVPAEAPSLHLARRLSHGDNALLRLRLLNLPGFSDEMFHSTPLPTLLALNAETKEPAHLSAAAAHAAAAHLSARPRDTDLGIKMAKALENLCSHPPDRRPYSGR